MLLFASAMVVIQSGPLPACLLDEAVGACFSMSGASPSDQGSTIHPPRCNDTSDEISRGWSQQQTFGNDGTVAAFAHVVSSQMLPVIRSPFDGAFGIRCHAPTPSSLPSDQL